MRILKQKVFTRAERRAYSKFNMSYKIKRFSSILKITSNLSLQEMTGQDFENIISQYVERIRKDRKNFKCFWILVDSRIIGTLHIQTLPGKILDIHWIDIEKEHRGHKYATTVLLYIIDKYAKKGYKEFHLEVPGNAPDARHIYEKIGFRCTGKIREEHNNSWNGLSEMILKL